jgi:hypothetical protein
VRLILLNILEEKYIEEDEKYTAKINTIYKRMRMIRVTFIRITFMRMTFMSIKRMKYLRLWLIQRRIIGLL